MMKGHEGNPKTCLSLKIILVFTNHLPKTLILPILGQGTCSMIVIQINTKKKN